MPIGQKKALAKDRSPPQDLEEGQHSGMYLLVMSSNTQGLHSANLEFPGDCCLLNTTLHTGKQLYNKHYILLYTKQQSITHYIPGPIIPQLPVHTVSLVLLYTFTKLYRRNNWCSLPTCPLIWPWVFNVPSHYLHWISGVQPAGLGNPAHCSRDLLLQAAPHSGAQLYIYNVLH